MCACVSSSWWLEKLGGKKKNQPMIIVIIVCVAVELFAFYLDVLLVYPHWHKQDGQNFINIFHHNEYNEGNIAQLAYCYCSA